MNSSKSTQLTPRTSNQQPGPPLGGSSGDWRYRLLRFHMPLALASVVVIFLWMSLPLFQAAGHQGPPPEAQQAAQATGHQGPPQASTPVAGHEGPPQDSSQMGSHQGSSQMNGQTGDHQGSSQAADATQMDMSGDQAANLDGMQNRAFLARFTTATGYVTTGLLALTLLIGPANLLLRRRTPISSYLTRDVGTWAAIISVVHVIVGLQVHGAPAPLGERILRYFVAPDGSPLTNTFGMGNWTGLAATVIVVGLLAISSDFALRKLKAGPWKTLQRLNYALFVLVILHAIYYGALLRVTSPSTILLGLSVSAVLIGQMVGIWLWRRRHARRTRERLSAGAAP